MHRDGAVNSVTEASPVNPPEAATQGERSTAKVVSDVYGQFKLLKFCRASL